MFMLVLVNDFHFHKCLTYDVFSYAQTTLLSKWSVIEMAFSIAALLHSALSAEF